MAHYAFLDNNNIVIQVIVGKDEDELDNENNVVDWEQHYGDFANQTCKRTSYNTVNNQHLKGKEPFRGNYAQIGYSYDYDLDVFIPPKPYPTWILDYSTFQWIPPVPKPEAEIGYYWIWIESNQEWIKEQIKISLED
jgi:hypothetical protein